VYTYALQGFAAVVPPARLAQLEADPRVVSVQPDAVVTVGHHCVAPDHPRHNDCPDPTDPPVEDPTTTTAPSGQTIPTGINRIDGSPAGAPLNLAGTVGVAVIDTGIDVDHPDLNVSTVGKNCAGGPTSKFDDGNGHGTHVAGTIGAIDNDFGVVGVAPGVDLYAVKVLKNGGIGFRSDIICGIDWVTENAVGNGGQISVANMSIGGGGSDDGKSCGATSDAYKKAICAAVNAGVTFVVAAGNESDDAANHLPAAYDMVITVSALADFDGLPGELATYTCRVDEDDTFANFSNYGPDVDIIAPGVCILSTWSGGGYNTISGTSMASPHVAGAAALYLSSHTGASPAQVQSALENAGVGWSGIGDPDGTNEPLLYVGGF
jgi:subtilisin family serine protease